MHQSGSSEAQLEKLHQNFFLTLMALQKLQELDFSLRGCCGPGLDPRVQDIVYTALNSIQH